MKNHADRYAPLFEVTKTTKPLTNSYYVPIANSRTERQYTGAETNCLQKIMVDAVPPTPADYSFLLRGTPSRRLESDFRAFSLGKKKLLSVYSPIKKKKKRQNVIKIIPNLKKRADIIGNLPVFMIIFNRMTTTKNSNCIS